MSEIQVDIGGNALDEIGILNSQLFDLVRVLNYVEKGLQDAFKVKELGAAANALTWMGAEMKKILVTEKDMQRYELINPESIKKAVGQVHQLQKMLVTGFENSKTTGGVNHGASKNAVKYSAGMDEATRKALIAEKHMANGDSEHVVKIMNEVLKEISDMFKVAKNDERMDPQPNKIQMKMAEISNNRAAREEARRATEKVAPSQATESSGSAGAKSSNGGTESARDVTENARDVTENVKDITENAKDVTENAKDVTEAAKGVLDGAKILGDAAEKSEKAAEDIGKAVEGIGDVTEKFGDATEMMEDVGSASGKLSENIENFGKSVTEAGNAMDSPVSMKDIFDDVSSIVTKKANDIDMDVVQMDNLFKPVQPPKIKEGWHEDEPYEVAKERVRDLATENMPMFMGGRDTLAFEEQYNSIESVAEDFSRQAENISLLAGVMDDVTHAVPLFTQNLKSLLSEVFAEGNPIGRLALGVTTKYQEKKDRKEWSGHPDLDYGLDTDDDLGVREPVYANKFEPPEIDLPALDEDFLEPIAAEVNEKLEKAYLDAPIGDENLLEDLVPIVKSKLIQAVSKSQIGDESLAPGLGKTGTGDGSNSGDIILDVSKLPHFADGGITGFGDDDMLATLQEGEYVLTKKDLETLKRLSKNTGVLSASAESSTQSKLGEAASQESEFAETLKLFDEEIAKLSNQYEQTALQLTQFYDGTKDPVGKDRWEFSDVTSQLSDLTKALNTLEADKDKYYYSNAPTRDTLSKESSNADKEQARSVRENESFEKALSNFSKADPSSLVDEYFKTPKENEIAGITKLYDEEIAKIQSQIDLVNQRGQKFFNGEADTYGKDRWEFFDWGKEIEELTKKLENTKEEKENYIDSEYPSRRLPDFEEGIEDELTSALNQVQSSMASRLIEADKVLAASDERAMSSSQTESDAQGTVASDSPSVEEQLSAPMEQLSQEMEALRGNILETSDSLEREAEAAERLAESDEDLVSPEEQLSAPMEQIAQEMEALRDSTSEAVSSLEREAEIADRLASMDANSLSESEKALSSTQTESESPTKDLQSQQEGSSGDEELLDLSNAASEAATNLHNLANQSGATTAAQNEQTRLQQLENLRRSQQNSSQGSAQGSESGTPSGEIKGTIKIEGQQIPADVYYNDPKLRELFENKARGNTAYNWIARSATQNSKMRLQEQDLRMANMAARTLGMGDKGGFGKLGNLGNFLGNLGKNTAGWAKSSNLIMMDEYLKNFDPEKLFNPAVNKAFGGMVSDIGTNGVFNKYAFRVSDTWKTDTAFGEGFKDVLKETEAFAELLKEVNKELEERGDKTLSQDELYEKLKDKTIGREGFSSKLSEEDLKNLEKAVKDSDGGKTDFLKALKSNKKDKAIVMGGIANDERGGKALKGWAKTGFVIATVADSLAKLGSAVVKLGKDCIESYEKVEKLKTQLGVVFGSQSASTSTYNDLEAYAKRTPFGVEQMTQSAIQLKQSGVYSSRLMDTIKAIGDVSSGNAEKFKSISDVYSRVMSSTTVTARDMRQLSTAGVAAYSALSDATGIGKSQIRSSLQAGKVTSQDFQKMFEKLTEPGGMFYKATEKGANTLAGKKVNVEDAKQLMKAEIGRSITGTLFNGKSGWYGEMLTTVKNIYNVVEEKLKEDNDFRDIKNRYRATAEYNKQMKLYREALSSGNISEAKSAKKKADEIRASNWDENAHTASLNRFKEAEKRRDELLAEKEEYYKKYENVNGEDKPLYRSFNKELRLILTNDVLGTGDEIEQLAEKIGKELGWNDDTIDFNFDDLEYMAKQRIAADRSGLDYSKIDEASKYNDDENTDYRYESSFDEQKLGKQGNIMKLTAFEGYADKADQMFSKGYAWINDSIELIDKGITGVEELDRGVSDVMAAQNRMNKAQEDWLSNSPLAQMAAKDANARRDDVLKKRIYELSDQTYNKETGEYDFGKLGLSDFIDAESMLVSSVEQMVMQADAVWDDKATDENGKMVGAISQTGIDNFETLRDNLAEFYEVLASSNPEEFLNEEIIGNFNELMGTLSGNVVDITNLDMENLTEFSKEMKDLSRADITKVNELIAGINKGLDEALKKNPEDQRLKDVQKGLESTGTRQTRDASKAKYLNKRKQADLWAQIISQTTGVDASRVQLSGAKAVMSAYTNNFARRDMFSSLGKSLMQNGASLKELSDVLKGNYEGKDGYGHGKYNWNNATDEVAAMASRRSVETQEALISAYQQQIDTLSNLEMSGIATRDTWDNLNALSAQLGTGFTLAAEELADGTYRFTEETIRAAEKMKRELDMKKLVQQIDSIINKRKYELDQERNTSSLNTGLLGRYSFTVEQATEYGSILDAEGKNLLNQNPETLAEVVKGNEQQVTILKEIAGELSRNNESANGIDFSDEETLAEFLRDLNGETTKKVYKGKSERYVASTESHTADKKYLNSDPMINGLKKALTDNNYEKLAIRMLIDEGTFGGDVNSYYIKNKNSANPSYIQGLTQQKLESKKDELRYLPTSSKLDDNLYKYLKKDLEKFAEQNLDNGWIISGNNFDNLSLKGKKTTVTKTWAGGEDVYEDEVDKDKQEAALSNLTELLRVYQEVVKQGGGGNLDALEKLLNSLYPDYKKRMTALIKSLDENTLATNRLNAKRETGTMVDQITNYRKMWGMDTSSSKKVMDERAFADMEEWAPDMMNINNPWNAKALEWLGMSPNLDFDKAFDRIVDYFDRSTIEGVEQKKQIQALLDKQNSGGLDEGEQKKLDELKKAYEEGAQDRYRNNQMVGHYLGSNIEKEIGNKGVEVDLQRQRQQQQAEKSLLDLRADILRKEKENLEKQRENLKEQGKGLLDSKRSLVESKKDEVGRLMAAGSIQSMFGEPFDNAGALEILNKFNGGEDGELDDNEIEELFRILIDLLKGDSDVGALVKKDEAYNGQQIEMERKSNALTTKGNALTDDMSVFEANADLLKGKENKLARLRELGNEVVDGEGVVDENKLQEMVDLMGELGLAAQDAAKAFEELTGKSIKNVLSLQQARAAMKEFGEATKDALLNAGYDAVLSTTKLIGKHMYKIENSLMTQEESATAMKKALAGQASALLDNISKAAVTAGFNLIGAGAIDHNYGMIAAGLGLVAAGGFGSMASGMLSAYSSDSAKDKTEEKLKRLEALKNNLADLLKQARDDAEYYEVNLRDKKALSTNEGVSSQSLSVTKTNDMILTPSGVFSTAPDDYIFAMKDPASLTRGNGNGATTVNFSIVNQSGTPLNVGKAKQRDDGMGNIDLEVVVNGIVQKAMMDGEYDSTFAAVNANQSGRQSYA